MLVSKYQKGQRVLIRTAGNQQSTLRDSTLEPYAGRAGQITDYHWISPGVGQSFFYIYTVKMDTDSQEIVVHEDELESHLE